MSGYDAFEWRLSYSFWAWINSLAFVVPVILCYSVLRSPNWYFKVWTDYILLCPLYIETLKSLAHLEITWKSLMILLCTKRKNHVKNSKQCYHIIVVQVPLLPITIRYKLEKAGQLNKMVEHLCYTTAFRKCWV